MTQNSQSEALSVCICSRKAAGISRNPGVFCLKNSEQGNVAMRDLKLEGFGSNKQQKADFPWRNCLCWALLVAFSACKEGNKGCGGRTDRGELLWVGFLAPVCV